MPIRLAILGLDPRQRDWLEAVRALSGDGGLITPVAVGHRTQALARDLADPMGLPAFDDLRLLLRDTTPQVLLMDRPENVSGEFLVSCLSQGIGILSLGPPVHTVAEARALEDILEARTHLLLTSPQDGPPFVLAPGYVHGTHPDLLTRPLRFVSAEFHGMHPGVARKEAPGPTVRSLSVLAWDALATLVDLLGLPETIYASIRGTAAGGGGDVFTDLSGAASLTLRFPDPAANTPGSSIVASVSVSDRAPASRRLFVLPQGGSATLMPQSCRVCDETGAALDDTLYPAPPGPAAILKTFLEQFTAPSSPHRGFFHRLGPVAACMEAMLVSNRTGQPESPERFLTLRR